MSAVFERYGDAVTYLIELKQGADIVEPFLELVREYGMEDRVIVQSSSLTVLSMDSYFTDYTAMAFLLEELYRK